MIDIPFSSSGNGTTIVTPLPVLSSSDHHSDDVVCVTLEASEDGLGCCWVPELQGELSTSLRMVGHTGGVEAAWELCLNYSSSFN